jgi:hypothetical protein
MLTAKQEAFCQAIAAGKTQYAAYLEAYTVGGTTGREVVDVNASQLMDDNKIAIRIQELRDAIASPKILSITQRKEILSSIAENQEAAHRDSINAIDTLNKMDRVYSTQTDSHITIEIEYKDHAKHLAIDAPQVKELTEGISNDK